MTDKLLNMDEFIAKVSAAKKTNKLDLSSDQDLSIALMNIISLEEHFYFSGVKTNDHKFYDLLLEVRDIRKSLLKKLVKEGPEGSEVWCISKHLLAASMRLMEVGTKQLDQGNCEYAHELFQKAYELYALFWGLNLGLVASDKSGKLNKDQEFLLAEVAKDISPRVDAGIDVKSTSTHAAGKSWRGKLGDLVRKLIDCCLE
jgi:hypothetical protein